MNNYQDRIRQLIERKRQQTKEKIAVEGLLDEDDYGRVVPPANHWKIIPNHENGSFYGIEGWGDNFCDLMKKHPVYVDANDAFAGRWMYFMSKMRPYKWNPEHPYDHLKPDIQKYDIICGIGDDAHFAPDYNIGLKLGWAGLLAKIDHYAKINTAPEQLKFYQYHQKVIRAIQSWIQRHIEHIVDLIKETDDKELQENLAEMLAVNQAVINDPPRSFREACQWIIWYHLASRTFNRDGAGGQLDELLRPYYEKDLAENKLDREKTRYLLSCFLINDPVYWQLGGPDKDGKDLTSDLSFLILEAADEINTSLNLTIRVHEGMNEELFKKGLHYLLKNKNAWPRFSGDKALVEGFVKCGYDEQLARERIAVGCNWMSLPGKEYTLNDLVKVNLAKVFEVAFDELVTGEYPTSSETLFELFEKHLARAVQTAADGIRFHLQYQKYNEVELVLNLLSHGPIEKGRDVSDGGAMYYNLSIDGAGLAVVADSFAAIEQRIETERKLTWQELAFHLGSDFEEYGGERIRMLLQNSPKYGQEGSIGETWAVKVKDCFTQMVIGQSQNEYKFIPGFFSWANTIGLGKSVAATANGRKAGQPISHGANPNNGFCIDGASLALANSIAKVQPGYGNTAPMQWELDPGLAREKYMDIIGAIIKTHFRQGGTLINVNIMDKNTILEAHQSPDKFPDLVVRVTGFTAYFSMLTPEFRQLVVDRIVHS